MADGGEKSVNKRNLSDLSKSFSDITRTPKKQRDECMSDNLHIATSTPLKESDFPPLPTMNAPVTHHVVIGEDDIRRIAMAVKLSIQEELADLVNQEVAKAVQPLQARITKLEDINTDLHLQLDELEQYGRRPLVRISGIPESPAENTTDLILDITSKAGIPLQRDDIINSHRVGTPNNNKKTKAGRGGPRQIIARLRSVDLKFRLVKSYKSLKKNPETKHVSINEDLTKRRDKLLFMCRHLCRKQFIQQAWSSNGKIRVRDNNQKIHSIQQESDLYPFGHTPQPAE